jgi:hypothetical protein
MASDTRIVYYIVTAKTLLAKFLTEAQRSRRTRRKKNE